MMIEEKNSVPKKRFKEFQNSQSWNQLKLGEVLKVNSGRDYKHLNKGNIPVYGTGGYMLSVNDKLSDVDGIGIGRKGTIDKPQYLRAPFWTVDTLFFMTPMANYDLQFLFTLSQNINWREMDESTGVPSLSKAVIEKVPRNFPSYQEQIKIGTFFKQLDDNIDLHQRKLEKTKALKSAYLSEMFPAEGESVPKRRFAGFTQIWEQRNLGELCQIGDIDHKMPQSVKEGVPYIMTGDFLGINDIDFKNSKLISLEDYEQLAKKIKPESGDILFARYASVGTVRYVETHIKFLVSYSCAILKPNYIANGKYLFYYLQANAAQRQVELEINTNSQRNIGIDSLKKLIVLLPQGEEQEKVATFFAKLDKLINFHQRKLEKLQNTKNAYLNELFV